MPTRPAPRHFRLAPVLVAVGALTGAASALPAQAQPASPQPADTSSAAAQRDPSWRARLLREARTVSLGAERRPEPVDSTVGPYPRGLPAATFAASAGPKGTVWVAGRVTSRAAYPRLGIARGANYVWVVAGSPVRMAVVPADASQPAHWIAMRPHAQSGTAGHDPKAALARLTYTRLALGACVPARPWAQPHPDSSAVQMSPQSAALLRLQ